MHTSSLVRLNFVKLDTENGSERQPTVDTQLSVSMEHEWLVRGFPGEFRLDAPFRSDAGGL